MKTGLLIFSLLFLIISFAASYNLQMDSKHNFSAQGSGYSWYCEVSFSSGFPFIFYETDQRYEGLATDKCDSFLKSFLEGTYKIPFDQVKLGIFILDVFIVAFLIFLLLEAPYFLLFEKLKLKLSIIRFIFSAILGFIWAFFGFGFLWAADFTGTDVSIIIKFTLFLPIALSINLILPIIMSLFGISADWVRSFFGIILPFIFATIIVYLITELIVRKRMQGNAPKQ